MNEFIRRSSTTMPISAAYIAVLLALLFSSLKSMDVDEITDTLDFFFKSQESGWSAQCNATWWT